MIKSAHTRDKSTIDALQMDTFVWIIDLEIRKQGKRRENRE